MFSAVAVGILVALSTFAWVYTWTMRRTGNNSKSAMITAGIAALFAFLIVASVVSMIDSALNKD